VRTLARERPEWVVRYGSQQWIDPGFPDARRAVLDAILEVVDRYDVDAVHLDDYFYPYPPASNPTLAFPDSATYAQRNPNRLALADWRRDNVNRFVERLYREVHAAKRWVDVGISPFGIWRPGNPSGINGLDAYASIYADARLWLQRGWVDYLAPQLYWQIDPPAQSFTALLDWWRAPAQNPMGRHVWPGIATYRVRDSNWPVNEIARQITATRARAASAGAGLLFYNTSTTVGRDSGLVAGTLRDAFAEAALPPASPWLDQTPPPAPTLALAAPGGTTGGGAASVLRLTPGAGEAPRWWAVAQFADGAWSSPGRASSRSRAPPPRGAPTASPCGRSTPPATRARR
jgi:uncharacterized lipoprotein YddW (UPF0748 family)